MWVLWVIMISCASWWDTALLYQYVRLEDEGKDEILVVGEVRIMWLVSTLLTTRKHMMFLKAGLKLIGHAAAQEVVYRWTWPGSVFLFSTMTHVSLIIFTIDKLAPISIRFSKNPHPWIEVYNPSHFPATSGETPSQEIEEVTKNLKVTEN